MAAAVAGHFFGPVPLHTLRPPRGYELHVINCPDTSNGPSEIGSKLQKINTSPPPQNPTARNKNSAA